MDLQITCIIKPDRNSPHERITAVGTARQTFYLDDVIDMIDSKQHTFFTYVNGKRANVVVRREPNKRPYLQTVADGRYTDNLLALQTCGIPVKHQMPN